MRVFIAVELPDPIRRQLAQLQDELKSCQADVSWVQPQNLHLTLKFLGEIEESRLEPLQKALQEVAGRQTAFRLRLEGIGAFPSTTFPRVIWVGAFEGADPLRRLAEAVDQACVSCGFTQEERPFAVHLTVGRVRSKKQMVGLVKKLQMVEFKADQPAEIIQVTLFQSVLSPKGPTYTALAKIPLGKATPG